VQSELLLGITRLEEFAGAVTEKLDTIDLETKRRLLLGLVKRVEIHINEIVVVFRSIHSLGLWQTKFSMIGR
jgi:site-specific DNA recombinase